MENVSTGIISLFFVVNLFIFFQDVLLQNVNNRDKRLYLEFSIFYVLLNLYNFIICAIMIIDHKHRLFFMVIINMMFN